MRFKYSKENLCPQDAIWQRRLEILPGVASWGTLIGMFLLSIFYPFTAAIITICFYLCWLLRLLYMTLFLVLSYVRLNMEKKTNWMERINGIDHLTSYYQRLPLSFPWSAYSSWSHRREIKKLLAGGSLPPASKDIYHLVIFPVIKEAQEVIEPALKAITQQQFPSKQIIVVFALEERAKDQIKKGVYYVQEKYKSLLLDCLTFEHPSNIAGEARVKEIGRAHV